MAGTALPARSWDESDVRGIELRAVSAHFGVDSARLELLLDGLLVLDCARPQLQPLLEQAWTRLQIARERLVDVRIATTDPSAATSLTAAEAALAEGVSGALRQARSVLAAMPAPASAQTLLVESLLAAVAFEFSDGVRLAEEAAKATDDDDARWEAGCLQAEFWLDQGREYNDADALNHLIALCEGSLAELAGARGVAADEARVLDWLGQGLGVLGRSESGTANLDLAVTQFERALRLRDRDADPFAWAATQNHLGNATGSLGQRTHDLAMLDRAVSAFEAALEIPVSNTAPETRASALSNLAAVLVNTGRQREHADALTRAVDSYRMALTIWTPERKPMFWASTQANLGGALRMFGEMSDDTASLEQAVQAYEAALSARTRGRMPEEWARTQNDIGAALQALAERTESSLTYGRAIAAFRDALTIIDRDDQPMTWAMTTANLGVARRKLAEYTFDVDLSRRAVADIRGALDVFRGASHARLTDLGLEQLAIAMEVNVELETEAAD